MTETSHTRSRRASIFGLLLQLLVFAGVLGLAQVVGSTATSNLAWYILGGALPWFVALLVFRQRELAALEALDLEELRREKAATGGGEAMFDKEGGGALGFRVAEVRLAWMQRWLIPMFGLLHALYLAGMGLYLWLRLAPVTSADWAKLVNLPIAMIALAVGMVFMFLFSRYASGMGRVAGWQLLRGCGSYMLGNALGALALIICLGVYSYAEVALAERVLAYALPAVMFILAAETAANFVLDIYRPRVLDTEPRACFDSRLLALIAEPGGIASTIAEALNYQFGFEVSQTWFYRLLQRTFVPLIGAGLVVLWLLTCIVIVQPGERAIIERFGAQLNTEQPYRPGLYWKLPWPIDVARKYNTGRLHQINVGFKQFDAEPVYEEDGHRKTTVALWTDAQHWGQPHFDFLIPVPPPPEDEQSQPSGVPAPAEFGERPAEQSWPVNMVRMDVAIQYRLDENELAAFTRQMVNPHDAMRDIAWEEAVRYNASWDIFSLLREKYGTAGAELQQRISARVTELGLGLEVVYVGVQNVHPEPGVSKEFRKVVTAEQEKIAEIRNALVTENQLLSAVAGDRDRALALARAVSHITPHTQRRDDTHRLLEAADPASVQQWKGRLDALRAEFTQVVAARRQLELARRDRDQSALDAQRGLGRSAVEKVRAEENVNRAATEQAAAEQTLQAALVPLRSAALRELSAAHVDALCDNAAARFALEFWNERLHDLLPGLQGEAAAILAHAQAQRWAIEMAAAEELTRIQGERDAYRAAPRIYKVRKYLEVLTNGIKDSRKFFLAFDPGDRQVRTRFIVEEQARPDIVDMEVRGQP